MRTKILWVLTASAHVWILQMQIVAWAFQPLSNIADTDHGGTDWEIISDTTIAGVHGNLGLFRIRQGVSITVQPEDAGKYGFVEIKASSISIAGSLNASGSGYKGGGGGLINGGLGSPGSGPGGGAAGSTAGNGGSGGGYGNNGGSSASGEPGGNAYGTANLITYPPSIDDMHMGSGGGGGPGSISSLPQPGGTGGAGGGAILLISTYVHIDGSIVANGIEGDGGSRVCCTADSGPGGGGSGGGILLYGYNISIPGSVQASGGKGGAGGSWAGSYPGGGGSGGRVKIFYRSRNTPAVSSTGGAGGNPSPPFPFGSPGGNGTVHFNQIPSIPLNISPLPNSAAAQPLFDWTDSADSEGPAVQNYEIQISSMLGFGPLYHTATPTQSQYQVSVPLPGIFYWRARAFDGEVYSDWSTPWVVIGDTFPPTAEGIVSWTPYVSSVTIGLAIATDTVGGLHAQPYWVEASSSPSFVWVTTASGWQSWDVWEAKELAPDTTYYFRTKARDAAFNETPWASTTSIKTLTPRPDFLATSFIGSTSVQIAWGAGINGPDTQYCVHLSTDPSFPAYVSTVTNVAALSFAFSNLLPNQRYYFRVANRDYISFPSEYINASLVTLPNPPLLISFGSGSADSIPIQWTGPDNPMGTQYLIEASSHAFIPGQGSVLSSGWNAASSYSFGSLSPNVTYYFRAKARNSLESESDYTIFGATPTRAERPSRPMVTGGFDEEFGNGYFFRVIPDYGGNSSGTELAIQRTGTPEFLQGDGTVDVTPKWMAKAQWESSFITNIFKVPEGSSLTGFTVLARNYQKLPSPESISRLGALPPGQPGNLQVTASDKFLNLNFTGASGNVQTYGVYYSAFSTAPVSEMIFLATTPFTNFSDDLPCAPSEPPMLSISSVAPTQIGLFWTAPSVTACGPRFYRAAALDPLGQSGQKSGLGVGSSVVFPTLADYGIYRDGVFLSSPTPSNARSFTDDTVAQGISYQYTVVARSSKGRISARNAGAGGSTPIVDITPPLIEGTQAVSLNGKTAIRARFSENVTSASVNNLAFWQVEALHGSETSPASIPLNLANLAFDNQKTVTFTIPQSFPNASALRVTALHAADAMGNSRSSSSDTNGILKARAAFTVVQDANGRKAQGIAVSALAQALAEFDREMDPQSLGGAVSLYMIEDRFGDPALTKIQCSLSMENGNSTAKLIPSAPLAKGSKYRCVVSASAKDAFDFSLSEERLWEFRTAFDYADDSIVRPFPGMKVAIKAGTFKEDAGIFAAPDPALNARYTSQNAILKAMDLERSRASQAGSSTHYPIPDLAFEIAGENTSGNVIQGNLGNNVAITLSYPDLNNDGIVDGAGPGVPAKDLEFYYLDENLGEFRKVAGSSVDLANKTVSAQVHHFSVYAVMGKFAPNVSGFIVRPNLWEPHKDPRPVILDNLPDPSEVSIYSAAGQKVRSIHNNGNSAIEWNGTNDSSEPLGSGVYLAILKGSGGTNVKKLTIVR